MPSNNQTPVKQNKIKKAEWQLLAGLSSNITLSLFERHIIDYANVWPICTFITLFLLLLLLVKQKKHIIKGREDYATAFGLTIFFFAYSFGLVMHLNFNFDNSPSTYYEAEVLGKRITRGKSASYHLELSAWGGQSKPGKVDIAKSLYRKLDIGDWVKISRKKGALEIPWFTIAECPHCHATRIGTINTQ